MKEEQILTITSAQNPRVKEVIKLRKRPYRDQAGLFLIEGYREIKRALDNNLRLTTLYYCRGLFLGENEDELISRCRKAGGELVECSEPVFSKMAYRERPDGLLAISLQIRRTLKDLKLPENPLLLVAEAIEKPGNLGTLLRSADAAGVHGVIVCDRCTDVFNPNVVRASIGTLFAVPVVEASTKETFAWLHEHKIQIVAGSPEATTSYTDVDLTSGIAVVVGSEQYGLESIWRQEADLRVSIPMFGQVDSLNVATAATILLFEAVRQRIVAKARGPQ